MAINVGRVRQDVGQGGCYSSKWYARFVMLSSCCECVSAMALAMQSLSSRIQATHVSQIAL